MLSPMSDYPRSVRIISHKEAADFKWAQNTPKHLPRDVHAERCRTNCNDMDFWQTVVMTLLRWTVLASHYDDLLG